MRKTFDFDVVDIRQSHFRIGEDFIDSEVFRRSTLVGRAHREGRRIESHASRPIHTPVLNVQESFAASVLETLTGRHVAVQEYPPHALRQGAPCLPNLDLSRGLDIGTMAQHEVKLYDSMCVRRLFRAFYKRLPCDGRIRQRCE